MTAGSSGGGDRVGIGADPDLGISWQTTAKDTIRSNYMGFRGQFYMYRIFNTARTPAQLRADMFNTHGNMASTTGLQVMYQFDEGTGFLFEDKENVQKKSYFEITFSTIVKILDEVKIKTELERILLCDVQEEISADIEKSFLHLLHDSGHPGFIFEKKLDFQKLYSERSN